MTIITRDGYFQRFFQECSNHTNYKEAYQATEKALDQLYPGHHRFESYESFRKGKERYLKNQRNKNKTVSLPCYKI